MIERIKQHGVFRTKMNPALKCQKYGVQHYFLLTDFYYGTHNLVDLQTIQERESNILIQWNLTASHA